MVRGLPLTGVGAVFANGRTLLAAGLEGGIAASRDGGRSWGRTWLEPGLGPVTCFAASPNFAHDGVLLAGAAGGGVLRSTDGGRIWGPANFGLRNFTLFALAAAGEWAPVWEGGQEWVFAGTADGVYASPNGGRAWQFSGLAGMAVLSLAPSPDFAHDRTVYAGTEAEGLFVSDDGGANWTAVEMGVEGPLAVNAIGMPSPPAHLPKGEGRGLTPHPSPRGEGIIRVVATSEYGVLFSPAPGLAGGWRQMGGPDEAACLGEINGSLLAGTYGAGLWRLEGSGGETAPWVQTELTARRFHFIGAAPLPAGSFAVLACQAGEALWAAGEAGQPWQAIDLPAEVQPLRLSRGGASNWLGASNGLYRLEPGGNPEEAWQAVKHLEVPEGITALAADGRLALAGSASGRLWASLATPEKFGYTPWMPLESPTGRLPLIALGLAQVGGQTLAAAAGLDAARRQIRVWRAALPADGPLPERLAWEDWLTEHCDWQALTIAAGPGGLALALGTGVLFQVDGRWQRREVTPPEAPLNGLAWSPQHGLWLAGTAGGLLASPDRERWDVVLEDAVADVWAGEGRVVALLVDGGIWQMGL